MKINNLKVYKVNATNQQNNFKLDYKNKPKNTNNEFEKMLDKEIEKLKHKH